MSLLSHPSETRTLVYMLLITMISIVHWQYGQFSPLLFVGSMVGAFAVSTMNHNHAHWPMWKLAPLNWATDYWFTVFQGHPGFAFEAMHIKSHHQHHNGHRDTTRTYRYRAGNDLVGLLRHPFEFALASLRPMFCQLRAAAEQGARSFALPISHYLLLALIDLSLLWLDWKAAIYCLLLPQAAAMFFLLASNYFQHAGAAGESDFNHSRNFGGAINPLFFNVGFHTAHHHDADCHWSGLASVHDQIVEKISPTLMEPSFLGYCWRTFVLHRPRRTTVNESSFT